MSDDDYACLESDRKRFEAGDKALLLYCVERCLTHNVPAPAWLKQPFSNVCTAAQTYEIRSWDEVFGRPQKKGQRLKMARRKMEIATDLFWRVMERYDAGEALDKELFAAVGKEFAYAAPSRPSCITKCAAN
jgi:hypothetical protein